MFYSVTCFQGDTERDVFSQQTIPQLKFSKSIRKFKNRLEPFLTHELFKVFEIKVFTVQLAENFLLWNKSRLCE